MSTFFNSFILNEMVKNMLKGLQIQDISENRKQENRKQLEQLPAN